MTQFKPEEIGTSMPACHPSDAALTLLGRRRSAVAASLSAPGPEGEALDTILQLASRVPDHRRVVPYRFITFEGEARSAAGEVIAAAYRARKPGKEERKVEGVKETFLRAPVVIAVVASVDPEHKTPEWEQVLTCGAVCQNLLLAASASGFAGQWLTEWYAYDADVLAGFGLKPQERIAGFIYLGTAQEDPQERPRVLARDITTRWSPNS